MRLQAGIELGENGSIFPRPKGASSLAKMKGAPTEADTRSGVERGWGWGVAMDGSHKSPGLAWDPPAVSSEPNPWKPISA